MCILLCMTGVGSQLGLTPFLFHADGTAKPVKAIFVAGIDMERCAVLTSSGHQKSLYT